MIKYRGFIFRQIHVFESNLSHYCSFICENGANTMVIIDPTASYQLIGPEFYEKFALPFHTIIIDAINGGDGKESRILIV